MKYAIYIYSLCLGLVILYGAFLRFYYLGESSFWIDEGFSSYATISGNNWSYWLHNLSQYLSFEVFGVSDWSARFPSVIFSLLTVPVIYVISEKLFQNKYISFLSVFIFLFAHIEIAWARQARFYTLLQLLFYIQILLVILFYQKKSVFYWCATLIVSYISIYFHPFLYAGTAIFLGASLMQIPNITRLIFLEKKYIQYRKNILLILLSSGGVLLHFFLSASQKVQRHIGPSPEISEFIQEKYILQYSQYMLGESGLLYILFFLGLLFLALKKRFLELIIFAGGFLIAFYAISQKGLLFHYRYVFFLFPLIYMLGLYAGATCIQAIKNNVLRLSALVLLLSLGAFSIHWGFIPKSRLVLPYTSPLVDFKTAYETLPDNAEVISGFPMLCEWYYAARGSCRYALAVNYTGITTSNTTITQRGRDNYTQSEYLSTLDAPQESKSYYFVLDSLSLNGMIDTNMRNKILRNGENIYNSGKNRENIIIIKY